MNHLKRLERIESILAPKNELAVLRCGEGEPTPDAPEGARIVVWLPMKKPVGAPVDF